jgi:[NiFe] hydrogenase diaphorase moiety large subunit
MHSAYIDPILERYRHDPTKLMQILREVQEHFGHIHADAIGHLAAKLGITRAQIESTASFYSFFYLEPPGQYRILFSDNITDRMLGNMDLLERLCGQLWIERGKVSEDGLVSVDTTSCTGMCDQGPAILVNNRAITRLTMERVDAIAELVKNQTPLADWPAEFFQIHDNIRRKDKLLGSELQPGEALRAALAKPPEALVDEVKTANLRGRGGAGFTTGLKWEACRNAPGQAHCVVCNADEGEPGTFKDRVLLTSYADKVFEGMTLCGYAIGAKLGMLYLRGEYRYLLDPLNEVLQRRRSANLLGSAILGQAGFDFDIEIHLGAGAYICGEESALIESLEGKRGNPRNRPPFPVTHGYLQQPTVVNNVETFAATTLIAIHGGAWYKAIGTEKSAGTKLLSVSGDCERPGIYEYPFGVTVAQVLEDCGAKNPQAAQVSGPSGVCIDVAKESGRRIAFEDIPTAGALMVFDQSRDMFEVARNFAHFFAHESCGFCTPCRVGTSLLRNLMDKLHNGHGSPYDFEEIKKLNQLLLSMSHCGLGHTACNPVLDTIAKFPAAYERRMQHQDFTPAFNLDWALGPARRMTGRDDSGAHFKEAATGETP